jgi:hypothetical protein
VPAAGPLGKFENTNPTAELPGCGTNPILRSPAVLKKQPNPWLACQSDGLWVSLKKRTQWLVRLALRNEPNFAVADGL